MMFRKGKRKQDIITFIKLTNILPILKINNRARKSDVANFKGVASHE